MGSRALEAVATSFQRRTYCRTVNLFDVSRGFARRSESEPCLRLFPRLTHPCHRKTHITYGNAILLLIVAIGRGLQARGKVALLQQGLFLGALGEKHL